MLFWLLVDVFWAGRGSHAISVFLTPVVCTDFVTSRGNVSVRAVGVVDTVTLVSLLLVLMQLQTDLYQSLVLDTNESDISQRFIIEWFCSYRPTLLHQPSALQKWRNLY